MTQHSRNAQAAAAFGQRFGRTAKWVASAPGRVNLIGEFTDFNEGFVLPIAIEQRTSIAAAPNDSDRIVVWSEGINQGATLALDRMPVPGSAGEWSNYIAGVLAGFMALNVRPSGFDALIHSDVPAGAGLSSSAALEVAFATLLEAVSGCPLEPTKKARLCQTAEHLFARVPCGIMDQFIATLGREDHALLLDCRSYEVTWLPMQDEDVRLLVIDSHVKHQHVTGAYAQRRTQCEAATRALGVTALRDVSPQYLQQRASAMDELAFRRARHIVTENERTLAAANCMQRRDWTQLGKLLEAAHRSVQRDYEASCDEVDLLVALAGEIGPAGGVLGARMTGGGFGGCVVALIRTAARESIMERIDRGYRERTGITASFFTFRPGKGAELVGPCL